MSTQHTITALLSILLLTSCATPAPRPAQIIRPNPEPAAIEIRTVPPGGIIAYNGDTLGPSPVKITTDTRPGNRWPDNGHIFQQFEARWPYSDRYACESYPTRGTVPGLVFLYGR